MSMKRRKGAAKVQTIKAWSYSRYQTWASCPHKARVLYLGAPGGGRVQLPASRAMKRGSDAHEQAERFLQGHGYPEHPAWSGWEEPLMALFDAGFDPEFKVAFTREFEQVEWLDAAVWLRAILDAVYDDGVIVRVVDVKTGQERAEHSEQADLYAACAWHLCSVPASVEFWYLDSGEIVEYAYSAEEAEAAAQKWVERGDEMTSDDVLAPTPGRACRAYGGCPLASDKMGHCEHSSA